MAIEHFFGEYRFLSNFYPSPITINGQIWPTVEHAYQASKTSDPEIREFIRELIYPSEAKEAGKFLERIPGFDEKKFWIMEALLRLKFAPGTELASKLVETYPNELIEGNTWGDRIWGVCNGKGENNLGKLLMKIRDEYVSMKRQ